MMIAHKTVDIRAVGLTEYEMRMLGEAFQLCGFKHVTLNGQEVSLEDMLKERNTWDAAWAKFDEEKGSGSSST